MPTYKNAEGKSTCTLCGGITKSKYRICSIRDPKHKSATHKAWRDSDPEHVRQIRQDWRKANVDSVKQHNKRWLLQNPRWSMLARARERAKKKDIECTIGISDIIIPDNCPILGIRLENKIGSSGPSPNSPSLDRLDNQKGYTPGNIWVISNKANTMKSAASAEELKLFAKWVSENYE